MFFVYTFIEIPGYIEKVWLFSEIFFKFKTILSKFEKHISLKTTTPVSIGMQYTRLISFVVKQVPFGQWE